MQICDLHGHCTVSCYMQNFHLKLKTYFCKILCFLLTARMHTAGHYFVKSQFYIVVISAGPRKSCQSLSE
jgi:hypothetical protein